MYHVQEESELKGHTEEIAKALADHLYDYQYFGLRITDGDDLDVGDSPTQSSDWDDGTPTDEKLGGASTIKIDPDASDLEAEVRDQLELMLDYFGDQITLIAGDHAEDGEDYDEQIIADGVALYVADLDI